MSKYKTNLDTLFLNSAIFVLVFGHKKIPHKNMSDKILTLKYYR